MSASQIIEWKADRLAKEITRFTEKLSRPEAITFLHHLQLALDELSLTLITGVPAAE